VTVERAADRSLNDLLVAGELDAVLAPHPPLAATDGSGRVVRLFSDARAVEEASYRSTGVWPIMHLIVLRADVDDAHPWLAGNLVTAFSQARDRSVGRTLDANASRFPVMWRPADDGDPWPYGVEPNRATLEAFLRFAHEQGVCARALAPEDLFSQRSRAAYRI
jgi:4,5-dihydroxyphthalate decarboxylase